MASTASVMESMENIMDLQIPQAPKLSPNGALVTWHTSLRYGHRKGEDNSLASIWLADVGKAKSARQITSGLFEDKNPTWCGESIIFTSDRKEAGKKCGLYQIALDGGEPILLTAASDYEKVISNLAVSPNGKMVAFLKADEDSLEYKAKVKAKDDAVVFGEHWEYQRLHLLHLATRTVETLVIGDFHVGDFVWSPESSAIAFNVQQTPEIENAFVGGADLRIVDIKTRRSKSVARYTYAAGNYGMQWIDDKIWTLVHAVEGVSFTSMALASISPDGNEWRLEYGGDSYCVKDIASHAIPLVVRCENDLYDELRDAQGKVLYRRFGMIVGHDAVHTSSENDPILVFLGSNINKPIEVFSLSSSEEEPVQLSDHGAAITEPIAQAIPNHTPSTDNEVELDAMLYIPLSRLLTASEGKPSKPVPTYIEPHGGPYNRQANAFTSLGNAFNQLILRLGYAVLTPNYRGGAGHGVRFAGPFVSGTHDWADVITLTKHIVDEGYADKERLMLGGWSSGGYLAYLAAVRNGTGPGSLRFRGTIAGAGIADYDSMTLTSDVPVWEAELGTADRDGAPWMQDKSSTVNRTGSALWEFAAAAREKRIPPMLMLHGQQDVRVPVTQAWGYQRACRRWGVEHTMVTYPREGHAFKERRHLMDAHERVAKFCGLHFA